MFIKEYITNDYPIFNGNNSVNEAAEIAKDFGYSHIFIVNNNTFIGALSQSFLDDHLDGKLDNHEAYYERFAIQEDSRLLDCINFFHIFNSNVIPVVSKEENYIGYISNDIVFDEFSKYPLFSENGAIITIQTNGLHYSMTEISQIIESNNSKIYGSFINSFEEDNIEITIKLSHENLSTIEEAFERYGYNIINKSYNDEKEELLKDRFGFFQKFLEI